MCVGYFSLTWLDSIPHIRVLLQVIIVLHWKGVWLHECGITQCSIYQCLNHQKTIIIIWSFNCLVALEVKCHLCNGSDFIVNFITCMLKHINATMQAFTRITRSIFSCLVIGLYSSFKSWFYTYLWVNWRYHERKRQRQVKIWFVSRSVCQALCWHL